MFSDSSSPHPYEGTEFSSFDTSTVKDTTTKCSESKTTIEEIATSEKTASSPPNINNHKSDDIGAIKNISKSEKTAVSKENGETSECLEHDVISNHTTEESNIEDLDLRLESLQLDFDNERVSVEDSLNSTFDDFGTFLTTSELNESLYLPKETDTDNNYPVSEKDTKSQETCSEDSVSLRNDDSSDFEVGWDNFNQPLGPIDHLPDGTIPTTSLCEETNGSKTETACKVTDNNISQQITLTDNVHDLCLEDISISDADLNSVEASELDFKSTDSSGIFVESKPIDIVDEEYINDNTNDQDEDSNNALCVSLSPAEDRLTPSPLADHKDLKEAAENSELTDSNDNIKDAANVILNNCTNQNIPDSTKLEQINSFDSSIDEFDDFATFQDAESVEILKEVVENVFSNSNPVIEFEANFTTFPCNESSLEPDQEADTINVADNFKSSLATAEDDDDFGDFDTYVPTSSAIDETTFIADAGSKQTDSPKITDLIHSNDTDIIEILIKAVGTIYPSDGGSETEDDVAESHELKTVLGENWKHLREYEAEQSYLFMWNNSASQKSLLKSLGIDSRNIVSKSVTYIFEYKFRFYFCHRNFLIPIQTPQEPL